MNKLVLIMLAATAAAAPAGAQTVPDPDGYGPPPRGMMPPPPPEAPPGVTWQQRAPMVRQRVVVQPQAGVDVAPGVRTRTWVAPAAPPPPPPMMAGGMHRPDGAPPQGRWMDGRDGGQQGRWMHGGDRRRHVEVLRFGPGYGGPIGPGFEGDGVPMGYAEGGPMPPPPPCASMCAPRPMPMPYGGYGYGYGGGVVVTETTVTEAPVVERRVWYTTVRSKVRVRHHAVRHCRCKLVKAAPRAGERG
jgi:hypothetical protein